ncbi:MAG: DUF4126 family protein [Candidatus Acidiferrales bacterium]
MNSSLVLALAFCIGIVAGLRSFTAPAVVCWAAHLGWLNLHGSHLAFMGSIVAVVIFTIFALAELTTDKLPKTPSRTSPMPLTFRVVTGALSGAALGIVGSQSAALAAVLGGVGAIVGTFAGYQVRHKLVTSLHVRDYGVAILEDLIAIGGGLLVVSRF